MNPATIAMRRFDDDTASIDFPDHRGGDGLEELAHEIASALEMDVTRSVGTPLEQLFLLGSATLRLYWDGYFTILTAAQAQGLAWTGERLLASGRFHDAGHAPSLPSP